MVCGESQGPPGGSIDSGALDRFRAYHLVEMADEVTSMDEAHRCYARQGWRFSEQADDDTVDAALNIAERSGW
jgi:hypothetical protein